MSPSARYRATGPGPKTLDGCSVELYRKLPYLGEVDLLKPWIAPGVSVLELGCGVGRVTRHLLAAGYRVTAVDNSAEMLAHGPVEAPRILSNIEDLSLDGAFDAVLLGSCLINVPDASVRTDQLEACRRHLKPEGRLLFERFDPRWLSQVAVGPLEGMGSIAMSVVEAHHRGNQVDLCFEYRDGPDTWRQYFSAAILEDADVALNLLDAGFSQPAWINRRWGAAVPKPGIH